MRINFLGRIFDFILLRTGCKSFKKVYVPMCACGGSHTPIPLGADTKPSMRFKPPILDASKANGTVETVDNKQ